jgi:uncharacterized OB-fold protein
MCLRVNSLSADNVLEFDRLTPAISDANRPFWDGCVLGELRLQLCRDCGHWRFPDSPVCPSCLSTEFSWQAASGRGKLWSWVILHQKYFAAYADRIPYLVAFIQLAEGPLMMSSLADYAQAELRCDMDVAVGFGSIGGDRIVPFFRIVR